MQTTRGRGRERWLSFNMAVRIRVRGDSTTEMDVMKVIMQRLSISEEDIRVVKKDGKDFIIKASIENTSRIAEKLRVKRWSVSHVAEEFTTRSVIEGNDDSDDIVFITVYYSFCLLGGEEHIDLTSIAKSIQGQVRLNKRISSLTCEECNA